MELTEPQQPLSGLDSSLWWRISDRIGSFLRTSLRECVSSNNDESATTEDKNCDVMKDGGGIDCLDSRNNIASRSWARIGGFSWTGGWSCGGGGGQFIRGIKGGGCCVNGGCCSRGIGGVECWCLRAKSVCLMSVTNSGFCCNCIIHASLRDCWTRPPAVEDSVKTKTIIVPEEMPQQSANMFEDDHPFLKLCINKLPFLNKNHKNVCLFENTCAIFSLINCTRVQNEMSAK